MQSDCSSNTTGAKNDQYYDYNLSTQYEMNMLSASPDNKVSEPVVNYAGKDQEATAFKLVTVESSPGISRKRIEKPMLVKEQTV